MKENIMKIKVLILETKQNDTQNVLLEQLVILSDAYIKTNLFLKQNQWIEIESAIRSSVH